MPGDAITLHDAVSVAWTYLPIIAAPSFPAWAVWRYFAEKRTSAQERRAARDERTADEMATQQRQLSGDISGFMDRQSREITALHEQLAAKDVQLDVLRMEVEGWREKARSCHLGWRQAWHDTNGIVTILAGLIERGKALPDPLPALPYPPPLEDLVGGKVG